MTQYTFDPPNIFNEPEPKAGGKHTVFRMDVRYIRLSIAYTLVGDSGERPPNQGVPHNGTSSETVHTILLIYAITVPADYFHVMGRPKTDKVKVSERQVRPPVANPDPPGRATRHHTGRAYDMGTSQPVSLACIECSILSTSREVAVLVRREFLHSCL